MTENDCGFELCLAINTITANYFFLFLLFFFKYHANQLSSTHTILFKTEIDEVVCLKRKKLARSH